MSLKTYLLPLVVTLVYSLNTWSMGTNDGLDDIVVTEVDGRTIIYDEYHTTILRQALGQNVDKLIAQKSSDFEGIDLQELRQRTQNVRVANSKGTPFVGSGNRNGAVNFTEKNFILLNREKMESYGDSQRTLIYWHEALGAMGYNDDNYLISSTIQRKKADPKEALHPVVRDRLRKQMNEPLRTQDKRWKVHGDGGVTGVGGGGDGDMAEIKKTLIAYVEFLAANNVFKDEAHVHKLLNMVIDTPIESSEFSSRYQNHISFQKIQIALSKIDGKTALLVNPNDWQANKAGEYVSDSNTELLKQMSIALSVMLQQWGGPL